MHEIGTVTSIGLNRKKEVFAWSKCDDFSKTALVVIT